MCTTMIEFLEDRRMFSVSLAGEGSGTTLLPAVQTVEADAKPASGTSGKVHVHDILIVKTVDPSSPG